MEVEERDRSGRSRPGGERLGPGEGEHPPQHQVEQEDQLDGRLHGPAHRLDLVGSPLCPLAWKERVRGGWLLNSGVGRVDVGWLSGC